MVNGAALGRLRTRRVSTTPSGCIGQMLRAVPLSPPWSFCLLLSETTQAEGLQYSRRLFDLRNLLSQSAVPIHQVYLESMPHLRWTVVSEVLGLLQAADWDLTMKHGRLALDYVAKMFGGVANTLGLENGFNDLRDNECRAARHKQRSEDMLQSLSISSMHTRYGDKLPMPQVTAAVLGAAGSVHCNQDIFDPTKHKIRGAQDLRLEEIDRADGSVPRSICSRGCSCR